LSDASESRGTSIAHRRVMERPNLTPEFHAVEPSCVTVALRIGCPWRIKGLGALH